MIQSVLLRLLVDTKNPTSTTVSKTTILVTTFPQVTEQTAEEELHLKVTRPGLQVDGNLCMKGKEKLQSIYIPYKQTASTC